MSTEYIQLRKEQQEVQREKVNVYDVLVGFVTQPLCSTDVDICLHTKLLTFVMDMPCFCKSPPYVGSPPHEYI